MSANREVTKETIQLFDASANGDARLVAMLLAERSTVVDINWHHQQSYGATALIAAIANGHAGVVELLLEAGAHLGELKTPDRNSPLHEAAFRDEPEILGKVLRKIHEQPGDKQQAALLVDLQNQFGNTPLHNAARTGSSRCVAMLLEAGARGATVTNANGSLPLHHACYCERPNLEVTKLLVAAGSDVNHTDEQGYTPLMIAAKKNQTDVIEFLRAHGANVSAKNAFGEDALHFATLRDNKGAMELLLSFGAETEPEASGH